LGVNQTQICSKNMCCPPPQIKTKNNWMDLIPSCLKSTVTFNLSFGYHYERDKHQTPISNTTAVWRYPQVVFRSSVYLATLSSDSNHRCSSGTSNCFVSFLGTVFIK
jgi:hypothetical protein